MESATSAAVESATSAAVESAKAGLSPEGVTSRNTAVTEPAEGAGMCACRCVPGSGPLKPSMSADTAAGPIIGVRSTRMKTIAIDDSRAVRDVRVVVVDHSSAVVPIESPIVPTPAEAAK